MNPQTLLVAFAIASTLVAQAPPSRIRAIGAACDIRHNSGLQAIRGGDGLIGVGAAYRVWLRDGRVRYEPALGAAAPTTQFVELSRPTVTRGTTSLPIDGAVKPAMHERVATYARGSGVEERFDMQPDGVELSWTFAERPAGEGDLVVRYSLATSFGEPTAADRGLTFAHDHGGVHIGGVTGIDARGEKVAGAVRWDGGSVSFSLPAQFVATGAYPITLDPLVGTSITVGPALGSAFCVPDAAYDASTDRWLVVWEQFFSGGASDAMAQIVSSSGFLVGPLLSLDPGGVVFGLRVADLGVRNRFGIVYIKGASVTAVQDTLEFRTVDAATGVVGSGATLTTSSHLSNSCIGAECDAPIGTQRGFVVAYRDGSPASVFAYRLFFTAADVLSGSSAFPVFTAGVGSVFEAPAISRTAAADGKLLIVAKRNTGSPFSGSEIVAAVLDTGSSTAGPMTTIASGAVNALNNPCVDGYAGQWVLAYEAPGASLSLSGPGVRVRPLRLDTSTNGLVIGSVGASFGGFTTNQAAAPAIAYASGRSWLAYRALGSLIGGGSQVSLRVAAVDTGSCATCGDNSAILTPTTGGVLSILQSGIATMTSGGVPEGEDALSLVSDPNAQHVSAQRLRDYGTVGTTTTLGGACGTTGAVAFNHAPGIGSSGFRCSLTGVPATALAAIFNFSAPAGTFPCGGCVWTPFSVTQSPPIVGGAAFVEFPIPCLLSLVGQQFETQWTVIDFTQTPCGLLAGLAASNRTLLTIGN